MTTSTPIDTHICSSVNWDTRHGIPDADLINNIIILVQNNQTFTVTSYIENMRA